MSAGSEIQRLDAAETLGQRAQFNLIKKAARRIQRPKIESQHGARSALLLARNIVLRV